MQNSSNRSLPQQKKVDVEVRQFAEWLHKYGYVYALYGLLDGVSVSYGLLKYAFDVIYTNNKNSSSDAMHDWLVSPAGIASTALESLVVIGLSFAGNQFKDKDKNLFKRFLVIIWPYLRAAIKGAKNTYKGLVSIFRVLSYYIKDNINSLVIPLALALGLLSALNRILVLKYIDAPRKQWMDDNTALLKEIQSTRLYKLQKKPTNLNNYINSYLLFDSKLHYVDNDGHLRFLYLPYIEHFLTQSNELFKGKKEGEESLLLSHKQLHDLIYQNGGDIPLLGLNEQQTAKYKKEGVIKHQSRAARMAGLAAAGYAGMVDGLYLFVGVVGISALAPHAFLAMSIFSLIFSSLCIGTRIFEEYNFQRRLLITEYKIRLTLCGRELEALFSHLHDLSDPRLIFLTSKERHRQQEVCFKEIESKRNEFEELKNKLKDYSVLSNKLAVVVGLRNGLAVYNTIASIAFAYAALNFAFPPALLITCISSGIVCLIICVIHAVQKNEAEKRHWKKEHEAQTVKNHDLFHLLLGIKSDIEQGRDVDFSVPEVKASICYEKKVGYSPEHTTQTWAEVGRSFFSGIPKGDKSIVFALNHLQATDDKGHYRETPLMMIFAAISSLLYSVVLALRAFSKGFGKPDRLEVGGDDEAAVISTVGRAAPQTPNETNSPMKFPELPTKTSSEGLHDKELSPGHKLRTNPSSPQAFFSRKSLRPTKSLNDLDSLKAIRAEEPGYKAPGLA